MENYGPEIELKTYDETYDEPLEQYVAYDVKGEAVTVNPKDPEKHQSSHPIEDSGYLFHNLGYIKANPHQIEPSKSNNPQAAENLKKGDIIVYSRDNFVKELDVPGYIHWQGDKTSVVVLYDKDKQENYTLTYYVSKK